MSEPFLIDGEPVSEREVRALLAMVEHDAKETAGVFFGMDRSAKFRSTWAEVGILSGMSAENVFVERNWSHFIVHVRAMYADILANPKVSEEDKAKYHKALIIQATMGKSPAADDRIQLAPGTQQFHGDKFENRNIAETYGTTPGSLRSRMMRTARRFN